MIPKWSLEAKDLSMRMEQFLVTQHPHKCLYQITTFLVGAGKNTRLTQPLIPPQRRQHLVIILIAITTSFNILVIFLMSKPR